MKETFTGVIYMDHVRNIELSRLVVFLYNFDYDNDLPDELGISLLQLHARMFALADQYDIPDLGTVALRKYYSRCKVSWDPVEFLLSIHEVYETTPSCINELRHTACTAIRNHLPGMLQDETVAEMYEEVLTENVEFAKDLLKSYIDHPVYGRCQFCISDQPMEVLQGRCKKCRKGSSAFGGIYS